MELLETRKLAGLLAMPLTVGSVRPWEVYINTSDVPNTRKAGGVRSKGFWKIFKWWAKGLTEPVNGDNFAINCNKQSLQ